MPQSASIQPHDVAFELKGRMMTLTVLHLWSADLNMFEQQLQHKIDQAPGFFNETPLVLDLSAVQSMHARLDLAGVLRVCREKGFVPVAARGVNPVQRNQIVELGLGILSDEKPQSQPQPKKHTVEPQAPVAVQSALPTMFIDQPVRSGQQIYAKGADLIVTASVSPGAEVLADGHIHIYGALRGRALAGVQGNTEARIFCNKLDAELISIAGSYRVNEDISSELKAAPVKVYLEGESLKIEANKSA